MVTWDGSFYNLGIDVNQLSLFQLESVVSVRPAIRIDLGKGFITMGHYEQDGNLENGPEDIEWVVVDEQDGKLLLVSRYALDNQPMLLKASKEYHWSESDLRTWLNSVFINTAFSEKEKTHLQSTELDNSSQGKIAFTGSGRYINSVLHNLKDTDRDTTYDRVFLLSYSDVCKYFPTIHSRICDVVKSVEVNIGYPVVWYLRTPITEGNGVVTIGPDGSFNLAWSNFISDGMVSDEYVRPAVWIG